MLRRVSTFGRMSYSRSSSYAAGLFNFKIVPTEMFPYPCHRMDGEEAENIQLVLESLRNNDINVLGNLYGARIASEYGGLGLGHTAHALIYEEINNNCSAKLFSTIRHSGLCTHLITTAAARDLKGKYLTGMSDGTIRMEWAIEEDGFGSDISMNITQAVLHDGEGYKLSGRKRCLGAASATHFLVLAKTLTQTATEDGATLAHRSSLFICSKDAPGLTIDGNNISLHNTPVSDVVGVIGEGFKDVMVAVFTEQYLYAVSVLGAMKRVIEEFEELSAEKGVVENLPFCAFAIYAMESVIYALTANMDIPTEDSLLECAIVSAFVRTMALDCIQRLEQLSLPNTKVDSYFYHAKYVLELMESQDFLYATAVCCGVEDYGLFFQKASTLQMMQARILRFIGIRDRVPIKNIPEASLIDEAVVSLGDAVEAFFVRCGSQVPYQQLFLNRIGEAVSFLYAASAVASRASFCITKGLSSAKTERQVAAAFIPFSVGRAKSLAEECCNNGNTADDVYKRIALDLCNGALR